MVFTESESKKPPEHIEAYEGNRCLSPPPSPPSEDSIFTMPLHPLDIKPAGNAFTAVENLKLSAGLFSNLPDDLVIQILDLLGHRLLISLGGTCKALYAFCRFDDLWKTLFIESPPSSFTWRGTWRSTYLNLPRTLLSQISCRNLYSDVLHRPFFCVHSALLPYASNIPSRNAIPRLSDLSASEFSDDWTNKPFILTAPVREWPAFREWSTEDLLRQYGQIEFRAEAVDWPLKTYVDYMNDNEDESPLYLFDHSFVEKMNLPVGQDFKAEYWTPQCFGRDLFAALGSQRPDSRWLIVGPARSGSTFHKDPNATSAWNAVLRGSKYWIMFPTSTGHPPPPGVFVSEDQSEVTSPLSIAEWLLGFHVEARRTPGCMEGVCNEGEVLHVPSGWWHLVVNLSPSIAVTQNFVPRAHLVNVLAFLKNKPDQVSGFRNDVCNPYETFLEKMKELYPTFLEEALAEMEKSNQRRKRKWDQLVRGNEENEGDSTGFSFGFGDEHEGDVP